MRRVYRHKWSLLSGLITLSHWAIIFGVTHYLYNRGRWYPDAYPTPHIVVALGEVHVWSILLSVLAALLGIFLERPPSYAVVAFFAGAFSYVIYVG
jgi:hypothetical protein